MAVGTRSPSWIALTMLLAAAIPSGVLILRSRPNDTVVSTLGLGPALRRGIAYASSGALYTVYMSIDVALVGTLVGSTQAGYYGIASGFFTAAATFPIVMNNDVLRTRLYRCRDTSDMVGAAVVMRRFLLLTLVAGTVGGVLMLVLAHPIVELLFGPAYGIHVARLVVILALAVLPNYFNSWAANVLIAGDNVQLVVGVQAAMTVLNVSANVALLPRHGVEAAAWITLVTEAAGVVLFLYLVVTRGFRARSVASRAVPFGSAPPTAGESPGT